MAEETANKKSHRDEETQGLEKVSDYVEELDAAPELGHVGSLRLAICNIAVCIMQCSPCVCGLCVQAMSMLEGDHSKKNEAKLKR